ncbi:uncharacterized protein LOC126745419 [Anthonomus grandis grandis]|uniref:uncharacterized protein LOC126745419 n=1 Tax=Anthonomus grandis grandis TaxID=2921223 RepID=UPI0021650792|nr:uncharacterized protein LOC126745419 [Anthonomus grandis grandis]
MLTKKILGNINKIRTFSSIRRNFTGSRVIFNKHSVGAIPNVQGLSENCVKVSKEPVGPGASKSSNYQNPEYFCYDKNSYFEAEVEMLKYRCPQPSVHKPYHHSDPK